MKQRTAMIAIAGVISILGLGGAAGVSALSDTTSPSASIVDRLVEKFNLNKSDVRAVFDEEKADRDTKRQAEMSDRLQAAVDDGDLTEAQKKLIEDKRSEWKDARDKQRDELEQWAEENDIDVRFLMSGMGMKGGHGRDF